MKINPVDTSEVAGAASRPEIQAKDTSFLEKVRVGAGLNDLYDARDLTEVVYRVMRDLVEKETIDHVADELHKDAVHTDNKRLQMEIADLWEDTNPIVGFISHIRQPLRGPAPVGIDSKLFLTRVGNEGAVPPNTNAETVVRAVFAATKDELSDDRIAEVAECLPPDIKALWQAA